MAKKQVKQSRQAKSDETEQAESPDFETSLGLLERIVVDLESGQLSLTDSIKRYEQGVGILRQCHTALDDVKQKIELLTSVDEQGEVQSEPFQSTPARSGAGPGDAAASETKDTPDSEVDAESRLF